MHRRVAIIGFLFLAACAPLTDRHIQQTPPPQPTSAPPLETPIDAVTIEPFEDPLAPTPAPGSINVQERVLSGGILEIGAPDAALTMTVFLHPESPYSQEFQRSRMPLLLSQFVHQGQLKMHLFILPIKKYAGSAFAARAVACAALQKKGFSTLNTLVLNGRIDLTNDDLAELEIDSAMYTSCIRTNTNDPLAASAMAAAAWKITLVPSYILHDTIAVGLPTETDLTEAVKAALR